MICTLYHVPIEEKCDIYYDALFYCWGSQSTSRDIETDNANFPITPNLHSALRRLRDEEAIHERNYQVGIMRKFYRCCDSVRGWIGEEADESDVALNPISQLSEAYDEQSTATNKQDAEYGNRDLGSGVLSMYDRAYTSLVHLMLRVYFQRVRIIQEVALASEAFILCGSSLTEPTWKELENAFNFATQMSALSIYRQLLPQNFIALQTSRQAIDSNDSSNRKLSFLLSRHCPSMATNSQDKIYALLGLCEERELSELGLDVDYNLPIKDLFLITMKKILEKDKNLDLLSATMISDSYPLELANLPSWIPD
ncbi:hypothetical protein HYALB_00007394 [Hymenoscyphus albidus]|uniref:Heterokaryon incompatibility domain-containing protein n=1 Tax=Hymenoscyphus albidus TaxID=595503 RepID=A0A9N9LX25_9HELO|nr:hypothetical protein HYALB_00007394 [Hymenoscyphus albidus]